MRITPKSFSGFLVITALGLCLTAPRVVAQELTTAVRAGDLAKVRELVERNPQIVNSPNANGETILFGAIASRHPGIIEYLITKGADINVQNNFHMAPLHIACARGLSLEIIKLLVERGADINAVSKYQGRPLDLAEDDGGTKVIEYLTSKGARSTPIEFEIVKLSSSLHRIAFPWGMRNNLLIFSGPTGTLVIDTGFSKRTVGAIRNTISGFARGEIKYVINTHLHEDHVSGNGLAPTDGAVISSERLGSAELRSLISRSEKPLTGRYGRSLPAPYMMKFNGENIALISFPGLHSAQDLMIYFPKDKVVAMGDLLLSQSCPAVENPTDYLDFLSKVIDVFPADTRFVGGHGRDLTMAGLNRYRDDLNAMVAVVKKNLADGKTVEDMIRADVLQAYKAGYSHLDWLGPDSWLRTVARSLQEP
jgi:cyclase